MVIFQPAMLVYRELSSPIAFQPPRIASVKASRTCAAPPRPWKAWRCCRTMGSKSVLSERVGKTFEPRKKETRILSIESWLVNWDPYFMAYLQSPHNWVVHQSLYTLNNQGPFFHCSFEVLTLWWFVDAIFFGGFKLGFKGRPGGRSVGLCACLLLMVFCPWHGVWIGLGYKVTYHFSKKTPLTMEKQPFEDVSPIGKMVIFHCHVSFLVCFLPCLRNMGLVAKIKAISRSTSEAERNPPKTAWFLRMFFHTDVSMLRIFWNGGPYPSILCVGVSFKNQG